MPKSKRATKTTNWEVATAVLPHAARILLYGPPGTGKTSIGFADGSDPYYFPCHEESSVAELLGHFVPVGNRFVWLNGPGLAAAVEGKRLILDEVDQASGAVLSVLRALLNDPGVARFTIPDPALATLSDDELAEAIFAGEGLKTISPTEGFNVIATMNGEPEDLDEPLLDRFEAAVLIDKPNPEAIASLPEDLRKAAEQTAVGERERRIGLRRWKAFAQLREHVGEDVAGRAAFGQRYGDVTDALKLARGTAETTDEATEDADTPAPPSTTESGKPRAAAYFLKTGKRGRPPRAECHRHGYITGRKAVEEDGNLYCQKCNDDGIYGTDALIAEEGDWTKRVMTEDGEWVTA